MCRKIYSGWIVLGLFLLFSLTGFSQNRIDELMRLKPQTIEKYSNETKPNTVALRMDFNSPQILNPADAAVLKDKSILRVELYYSAFQVAESFSQPALNRERYEAFQKLCPDLFKQTFPEWKIIGQVGCHTPAEAKNYFHGFVITYLPVPDKESAVREVKSIRSLLKNDSLGHDTEYVTVDFRLKKTRKRTGYFLPRSKSKREEGIRYTTRGLVHRRPEYVTRVDTIFQQHKHKDFVESKTAITFMRRLSDSTIFKVLERHSNWQNIMFVCDVTGSMSPYTTEVLMWHKLNYRSHKAKYFTFFNDGDDMPDRKKKIGRTGGIYSIEAGNYEAVEISLYNAMDKGSGGDAPENNCEAILKSLQQMPDAGEIVMIADNWARIKDLELATLIKRPVHIILCGAENGYINVDYLELARKTKGSVHVMSEDMETLMKFNEGQTFTFGQEMFKIVKGKIVPYNPA
jgi:hypothetical protein